jgi:group I intron endonuclease
MAAVYRILNVVTDDFYIGSTRNPKKRRWEHWNDLKLGKHHCAAMQAAWSEFGPDAFEFEILEDGVAEENLLRIEDAYLVQHAGQPYCYNTALSSMQPPAIRPETIEKIRASTLRNWAGNPGAHPRLGRKHTEETKAKIRAAKLANPVRPWLGKTRDAATRKKIGDAQRGVKKAPRVVSEEGMAKIRAAAAAGRYASFKGRRHKEESKAKLRKTVFAMPDGIMFPSLTSVLAYYGLKMPTLRRALMTGLPISRGPLSGYQFSYGGVGAVVTSADLRLIRIRVPDLIDTQKA